MAASLLAGIGIFTLDQPSLSALRASRASAISWPNIGVRGVPFFLRGLRHRSGSFPGAGDCNIIWVPASPGTVAVNERSRAVSRVIIPFSRSATVAIHAFSSPRPGASS